MRGKNLLECMEHIDDALVEEALEPAVYPRRNSIVGKWGMAAACVVVIGISAAAFWSHQNIREARVDDQGIDTASPPIAIDNAAASDSGSAGAGAAVPDTQTGTMAGGADEGAASGGISDDLDTAVQDSADSAASSKEDSMATAGAQSEMSEMREMTEEMADTETKKHSYTVISDYYGEKEQSVYDYPIPEKGKFFCYHYLQETMKYYAELESAAGAAENQTYAYDVVIDIYGDVEKEGKSLEWLGHSDTGNERIEQEYRRLTELGYTVRLSEDFQLTGIFTKMELDTFQASPEYGYTFRFASEN